MYLGTVFLFYTVLFTQLINKNLIIKLLKPKSAFLSTIVFDITDITT